MQLGLTPYGEAWELQRALAGAVSQGAIPDTVLFLEHPPVVTLGRRTDEGELHVPEGRRGRGRRDRPRRQVHLPRPGAARLLPDPRPQPARARREALLPRPRGGRDPHARRGRRRGGADRRADRRLAHEPAAQDRLDRRPHLALGDDARLRAQRRPRPGAVHAVDHRVRSRGRGVHDRRARARPADRRRRHPARARSRPSRTCSGSPSRSFQPRTAPGSGPSPCTSSSPRARNSGRGGRCCRFGLDLRDVLLAQEREEHDQGEDDEHHAAGEGDVEALDERL